MAQGKGIEMITRNLKIDAQRNPVMRGIELYFYEKQLNGKISVMSNMEFTEIEQGVSVDYKGLTLSYETAQELIDNLWSCGLRPSEGTGSAGSLKATENHLKDMQSLSWKLLAMVEGQAKA